jgi:acyl-CoA thioester hydrolase
MSAAGPLQGARPLRGNPREAPHRGDASVFSFPVSVYYEDTDAAGVVYYANYLKFMERARTEWLASLGFPLAAFEREHGVAFVVHRVEVDFIGAARLNDRLDVTVEPVERGASRLVAMQEVRRGPVASGGEPQDRPSRSSASEGGASWSGPATLVRARVALACIDTARWKPARIPKLLRHALEIPF